MIIDISRIIAVESGILMSMIKIGLDRAITSNGHHAIIQAV